MQALLQPAARLAARLFEAMADKRRTGGVVSGERIYGDGENRLPVIVDDLISSGGTIARTAAALAAAGAKPAIVAVTHGVFSEDAADKLAATPIARMLVTDSIDPPRLTRHALPALEIVSVADLVAGAIARSHAGQSLEPLLGMPA